MAASTPAMSPSGQPAAEVLDRATGPRRAEADELLALLAEVSGLTPTVWAGKILGFGTYEYRYASGHGGIAPLLAYAPTTSKHTLYLQNDFAERWPELLERLGPHRASKACLYLTRLAPVDREVLRELLRSSLAATRSEWPEPGE